MNVFLANPKTLLLKSLDDTVNLYVLGDIHAGEKGCDEVLLGEVIDHIKKDKRAVVVGNGDYASFITPDDKRFDPSDISEKYRIGDYSAWGDVMTEAVCDALKPIANKILGMCPGNHEEKFGIRHYCDPTGDIAKVLKVPRLEYVNEYGIFFKAKDGQRTLEVHQTHGTGFASTPATKLGKLARIVATTTAHLTILGHVHGREFHEWNRTRRVGNGLALDSQYGVITNTFTRTYKVGPSNYAEKNHYPPVKIGCPCIEIHPRTLQMNCRWLGE